MAASTLLTQFAEILVGTADYLGYFGIFVLSALESSFLPIPVELTLIPAGVLVARGEMFLPLVLFFAIFGTLIGALINYSLSLYFGRRIIENLISKYGKFFFFDEKHIKIVENYFDKHGHITTFTGRLIPVVRHLISIPAGFARMNLFKFCLYTVLGSSIWISVIVYLGYVFQDNSAIIQENLNILTFVMLIFVLFVITIYLYFFKFGKSK